MPNEDERRPRREDNSSARRDDRQGRPPRTDRPASSDRSGAPRRDGAAPRRDGGAPRRDGGAPRRDGAAPRRDTGANRGFPQRAGTGRDRPDRMSDDRPRHNDPEIPEEITPQDLHTSARNELKTLSKENADEVARHLAMAAKLIDEDPALAHQHALAASRRAGRIAIVRETLGITAYATGDFALALREMRTYRRISGKDDQIALMVDSERGIGRPDRALETGRAADRSALPTPVRVALAIAMSGARLDLGETELALGELEIPELDPDRAFEWSPALFSRGQPCSKILAVTKRLLSGRPVQKWHPTPWVLTTMTTRSSSKTDSSRVRSLSGTVFEATPDAP
ncbi:hypothetical protein [Microbacterium sp. CH12i]|uniref:hypothetical protein n=1 Tax=Microbacterium sp. CH12i TaxID=1479651 RepID=UPI001F1C237E|nr:hypothetical protein [Microbacterium sp. CH12i]